MIKASKKNPQKPKPNPKNPLMHVKEQQRHRGMSSMERCPRRCCPWLPVPARGGSPAFAFWGTKGVLAREERSVPPWFVWDGCHHQHTPAAGEMLRGICQGRIGSAETWAWSLLRHPEPYLGDQKMLQKS